MSERLTEGGVARLGAGPGLDLVSGQVLVWRWVDRSVVCSAVPQSHPTPSSTLEVNRSPCWSPTLTPTSPSAGCPTTCRTSGPRHEIQSYDHASISCRDPGRSTTPDHLLAQAPSQPRRNDRARATDAHGRQPRRSPVVDANATGPAGINLGKVTAGPGTGSPPVPTPDAGQAGSNRYPGAAAPRRRPSWPELALSGQAA